ncbi:MAG: hypothetical protein L6277_16290 [Desulfobacterales bacterium]|nr:hypothetical protein [Pseudomonadota bacterium]MBU4356069.1 hypothetical protein [Pseudomonadota bacterium]MCG2773631.1 hypothetical protein [Desulfobacterales bacterium]
MRRRARHSLGYQGVPKCNLGTRGKGGGDRAFVIKVEMGDGLEFMEIGLDGFMGGFEVEGEHGRILAMFKRG